MKYFKFSKLVLPEVVLLAILVIGLIISHSIVLRTSYIKLSPPNEVPASGFSFCMPEGTNWQTMPAMKYSQNSWFLTSVQAAGRQRTAARLTISYLLAAGRPDANDWLIKKTEQLGEKIGATKIIAGKDVTVHAAIIDLRGQPLNIFYGIAILPGGRSINIEFIDMADDPEWGWSVLERVSESFVFKGNPLLEEGTKVVDAVRSRGIKQFIPEKQEDYFVISTDDEPEGFNAELISASAGKQAMNVRAINSHFIQQAGGRQSILQCSDKFETFVWISNELGRGGSTSKTVETRLDLDGTMSIKQQGHDVEAYTPGPAAIPEPFSEAVFRQMADAKITEALVDFVGPQGQIMPGFVELEDLPRDSNGFMPRTVRVKLFIGEEITSEINFDPQGSALRYNVTGKTSYRLIKSSKQELITEFPAWNEYIMNLNSLLKEDMEETQKLRRIVRDAGKFI